VCAVDDQLPSPEVGGAADDGPGGRVTAQDVFVHLAIPSKTATFSFFNQIVGVFTVSDFSKLLSHEHILALIDFSILVGVAAAKSKEKGQAFIAFLHSGEEVVLKVQHTGIADKIMPDLDILAGLAELAEKHSAQARPYQPSAVVRQFQRTLLRELDFSVEARNADRMRENLRSLDFIKVPKIYWEWTSEDLNVQEYIRGISAKKIDELDAAGMDRKQIARRGARAVWKMMLEDGFFHADPHPGNFIILPGNRIAMLDFGMGGRLTAARRDQLIRLIRCVLMQEPESATMVLVEWAGGRFVNREALNGEVTNLLEHFDGVPLESLDVSGLLNDVAAILRNHNVRLPSDITLLVIYPFIFGWLMLKGYNRYIKKPS